MSRTAASPLCRSLAVAIATCLLCGCDPATPDVKSPPRQRQSSPHPDQLDVPIETVATPVEQVQVLLEWYTAKPLPAIGEQDQTTVAPIVNEDEITTVAHDSANTENETGRSPATPDFDSAYAVSTKRLVDLDDRLVPLSGPSNPTSELIAVARQADVHVGRGFRLAERGALFTARAELLQALRLSAAALDEQRNTGAHRRALANGMRALNEAEDFVAAGRTAISNSPSIAAIVRGHRTPVLDGELSDDLNTSRAIERYLTYAQEQLAAASGDLQPAASALYALGKLEMAAATDIGSFESSRAAVYLQAALIVNPQHALAANELGVLLARHGRLAEAKAALSHTLRFASLPAAWRNLSIVHHGLGEMDLAGRADREWQQAAGAQPQHEAAAPGAPAVQWVDPATFAQSAQASADVPVSDQARQVPVAPKTAPADAAGRGRSKGASSWFPWAGKPRQPN